MNIDDGYRLDRFPYALTATATQNTFYFVLSPAHAAARLPRLPRRCRSPAYATLLARRRRRAAHPPPHVAPPRRRRGLIATPSPAHHRHEGIFLFFVFSYSI
jgi:hypothetical protein